MKLKSFEVHNFRSINESGLIEVTDRTVLVGRNESGKTNLLIALHSLNPTDGVKALSYIKDFPRDRPASQFSADVPVVTTRWEFTINERAELAKIWPRAAEVRTGRIGRKYAAKRWTEFDDVPALTVDYTTVEDHSQKMTQSLNSSLRSVEEDLRAIITNALAPLLRSIASIGAPLAWANGVTVAATAFHQTLTASGFPLAELAAERLSAIEKHALDITSDDDAHAKAQDWAVGKMPKFIYLADYPELEGHQDIPTFLARKMTGEGNEEQKERDANFEKLMKVAGLDPAQLNDLLGHNHEQRQQLTNRAGAVVTRKLRQLWTDRLLKVRFNLDADHFDTLVSDPNNLYDVEINFNERSRGFKWFFSFYVTFAADTESGPAEDAILLLDEPGLFLHAVAQKNLIGHFAQDFKNQILYTTHSPFMIPVDDIPSIRTVNIGEEIGTTVANDPIGDSKTLFPLQTALSYDLTQTLFVGEKTLVVEGVSDYWYLSAVSDYLNDEGGGKGLPRDMVITPAGGAPKISYMVSLLASQSVKVITLLDEERDARKAAADMVRQKLIRDDAVLFVTDAFTDPIPSEADVEDLLDPAVYQSLIEEAFKAELVGRMLTPNPNIPRLAKRYEEALKAHGIGPNKTRPAKLFLKRMASDPAAALPTSSRERFERLFALATAKMDVTARRNLAFS